MKVDGSWLSPGPWHHDGEYLVEEETHLMIVRNKKEKTDLSPNNPFQGHTST